MRIYSINRKIGALFFIVVFTTALLIGTLGNVATQHAQALQTSNGSATWYDPYTLIYTDSGGEKVVFRLAPDYAASGLNVLTSLAGFVRGDGWGTDTFSYFAAQSFKEFRDPANPFGDYSQDTDVCEPPNTPDTAPIGGIDFNKNRLGSTKGIKAEMIIMGTKLKACWLQYDLVTITNNRPPLPDPGLSGSLSWVTQNIMDYHGDGLVKQYGISDGQEFDESAINGNGMTLTSTLPSGTPGCEGLYSYINVDPYNPAALYPPGKDKYDYKDRYFGQLFVPVIPRGDNGGAVGNCELISVGWIHITNTYLSANVKTDPTYSATWITGDSIQLSGNDSQLFDWGLEPSLGSVPTFTKSSLTGNQMVLSTKDKCENTSAMTVNPYLTAAFVQVVIFDSSCNKHSMAVTLTNSNPNSTLGTSGTNPADNGGCPVTTNSGIDWILCPLFNVGKEAVKTLHDNVQNLLYINTDQIFNGATFEKTFVTFRNISVALLILGGLFMVLSQAAGFEVFSAYTVRKALPRIVIAAIGISLAWPIMQFAVTFFNDTGTWIESIILNAANVPNSGTGGATSGVAEYGVSLIDTLVVGGGVLIIFGFIGALSFIASVIIALVTALMVLVARQLVVLACIILAPIAIAASILPGTARLFTLWRTTLLSALAMFPIIMGIIATGTALSNAAKVAAGNSLNVTNGGNGSGQWALLAFIAYFVPYLIILRTPALGGALIGQIGNLAQRATGGLSNVVNGYRNRAATQNMHALASGSRFDLPTRAGGWIGDRLNGFTGRVAHLDVTPRRAAARYHSAVDAAATAFGRTDQAAIMSNNDNALRALSYSSAAAAQQGLRNEWGLSNDQIGEALATVNANGGFGRAQQVWATRQMTRTGTAYRTLEDESRAIARASHGNRETILSLAGGMNAETKGTGRFDLAPGAANLATVAEREAGIGAPMTAADYNHALRQAWNSPGVYQLLNGKDVAQTQRFADSFVDTFNNATATNDERIDAAIALAEMQHGLASASGGNQVIINQALTRAGFNPNRLDGAGNLMSAEQQLSDLLRTSIIAHGGATTTAGMPTEAGRAGGGPRIENRVQPGVEISEQLIRSLAREYDQLAQRVNNP